MEFSRNLSKGMAGDDVLSAKQHLFALGFYDGVFSIKSRTFGNDTVKAVKRFQQSVGLDPDGIIGELTWEGLFEQDAGVVEASAPVVLQTPSEKALSVVRLARERIGDLYVWGASGQTDLSNSAIQKRDDADGASRSIKFRDAQIKRGFTDLLAHDCSGFISWLFRECGVWDERRDCDALWSKCTEVTRAELIPGDLMFRVSSSNSSDETHVGLYCGRGIVIHDKGRDAGVVLEGINHGGTSYWAKCGRFKPLYQ